MSLADSSNSIPVPAVSTRRAFISTAAGAVLALATIPPSAAALAGVLDPIYGIIDAHRAACKAYLDALDEQCRLEELEDPLADSVAEEPCHAELDAFDLLIETAPVTAAGLSVRIAYLDEILAWLQNRKND
jgi:hypothetical protein